MSIDDKKLWTYHQTTNINSLKIGHPRQDMLFKIINKLIIKGKILEIGFGDGYLLQKLSPKYDCYGADISIKNIKQMKKNIPKIKFKSIGVDGKLPFQNNTFDGFIASEVLEHMSNDELLICIKEIKRILKNGGYGFITVPAQENLKDNECFCPYCGETFHKWGHKQSFDQAKIISLFKKFTQLKISGFFTPYIGNNQFEKIIGKIIWLLRTITNKFTFVPNGNYLIICKNR